MCDGALPSLGDDCDESRARSFPHGAGSGRGQLHVGAVDVTRISARGSPLPRGPVHGQLRPLRPVPGLPAAAGVPWAPWYLHAALAFSPQPSQPIGTQSCFSATRYVTISVPFLQFNHFQLSQTTLPMTVSSTNGIKIYYLL